MGNCKVLLIFFFITSFASCLLIYSNFYFYCVFEQIKPNIVQISLATCCVVPPALQTFTKENDVQLLTHSDPGRKLFLYKNELNEVTFIICL